MSACQAAAAWKSDCRIVILTVFEDEAKISQAISAGASGYLLKTSTPDEIAGAIIETFHGGSPMSPHVASSVVKLLARLTKPAKSTVSLSPREMELLRHMVDGLTAKEIAASLDISIHTADTHTRNLYGKLGVRSRAAAVARALREKLV
jgi:DNA-binding NarL/FixJ family response regulator